jgi:DNA-binding transcriptional LysR family regulator
VRLLQRPRASWSLTEEGRLFYERCTGPLLELEGAQAAVR